MKITVMYTIIGIVIFVSCILYIIIQAYNQVDYNNCTQESHNKNQLDEYKGQTITYKEFKQLKYIKEMKEIKEKDSKKIPKFIFRSAPFKYDNLPEIIVQHLTDLVENNPDYIQIYFDDDDCIDFIKEYFPEYLTPYNSLRATAFKSDIWRLLVLYQFGGIYNDIGHIYKRPISDIVSEDDELILCRENENDIHNAFIACYPKHKIILKIFDFIIDNVNKKQYGIHPLDITGPIAIGKCIYNLLNKNIELGDIYYDNYKIVFVLHNVYGWKDIRNSIRNKEGIDCIQTKFPDYYNIMYYSNNNIYYGDLWHNKQVYKE